VPATEFSESILIVLIDICDRLDFLIAIMGAFFALLLVKIFVSAWRG